MYWPETKFHSLVKYCIYGVADLFVSTPPFSPRADNWNSNTSSRRIWSFCDLRLHSDHFSRSYADEFVIMGKKELNISGINWLKEKVK